MNALALLNNLERDFGRPFFRNSWLNEFPETQTQHNFTSVMRYDDKKSAWNLTVELAGVTKENIKIDTADGYLQLSGEKTKGLHTGKFEGSYRLPEGVDAEKIEATFEDGILSVEIPMMEKKTAKPIQIK